MNSEYIYSKSVLVVRTGALGDTILGLPLLESVRIAHPGEAVFFLGNRAYKELIPEDIEFGPVDSIQWSWLFSPDSVHPSSIRLFRTAYVILNKPDIVIRNLKLSGTRKIVHTSSLPPCGKHIIEHVHQSLGLPTPAKRPLFTIAGEPSTYQPIIWLHPGSGGRRKCVPLKGMIQIARQLRTKTGFKIVITTGEEDEFLKCTQEWGELLHEPGMVLIENRPLSEITRRLRKAAIFIGNDSGISHLAANLGIRSIVFFVITDPVQWAPWVPEKDLKVVDMRDQNVGGADWINTSMNLALDFLSPIEKELNRSEMRQNYSSDQ